MGAGLNGDGAMNDCKGNPSKERWEELSEALGELEEGAGSHTLISVVSGCCCLLKH